MKQQKGKYLIYNKFNKGIRLKCFGLREREGEFEHSVSVFVWIGNQATDIINIISSTKLGLII